MKAKVSNIVAKHHPYIFSHYSYTASLRAESAQVINAVHKFYTLITMTSLQLTQAQGLGYTRRMYRVPLSIQTYNSVIKVHGLVFSLITRQLPPTWPRSNANMI